MKALVLRKISTGGVFFAHACSVHSLASEGSSPHVALYVCAPGLLLRAPAKILGC